MHSARRRLFVIQQFREAKIENFYLSRRRHHYVPTLDVAVNDAARVRDCERISDLDTNQQCALQFKRMAADELSHIATFDVLHGDEVDAFDFIEIEYGADIWMIER